jgi:hypothetical protein
MKLNFSKFLNLFIFLILILILILSQRNYYGNDVDTYAVINTFLQFIEESFYSPSRLYGSPLAEFILGFLLYNFGPNFTNFLIVFLFIASIYFLSKFFLGLNDKVNKKLFILLCISNPLLVFDNINISDYPLALFFFSLGLYFYKKNNLIGLFLFCSSIACRTNFILFSSLIIILNHKISLLTLRNLLIMFIFVIILYYPSLLFYDYKPINNSPLGGLRFEIGEEYKFIFKNQVGRFFYKVIILIGFIQSIIIFFYIIINLSKIKIKDILNKYYFEILLILLNLFVFLLLPTKISIISLFIILFYIILVRIIRQEVIYLLIILNLFSIFIYIDFLKINYRFEDKCKPIQAISANFEFSLKEGHLYQYLESSKYNFICRVIDIPKKYRDQYYEQKKLKVK